MIDDEEAARAVTGWLKLGDKVAGRKPEEGQCDQCGERAYLTPDGSRRLCARCLLARGSNTE